MYALLGQMIGECSTFPETVSVLGGPLPAYRHDLLSEFTKGPEYVVLLVFVVNTSR